FFVMMTAVLVVMVMQMSMVVVVPVAMLVFQMDVELHALDCRLVLSRHVEVVSVELQFLEFTRKFVGVHAEVDERADEHVAGD
ncbi:hypothetical protein NL529_32080, partial [Klebsiella pneumoniae]|nr:hypothetical protein [Klebsiella pneumoniae]